jgi:hypothetical protein
MHASASTTSAWLSGQALTYAPGIESVYVSMCARMCACGCLHVHVRVRVRMCVRVCACAVVST